MEILYSIISPTCKSNLPRRAFYTREGRLCSPQLLRFKPTASIAWRCRRTRSGLFPMAAPCRRIGLPCCRQKLNFQICLFKIRIYTFSLMKFDFHYLTGYSFQDGRTGKVKDCGHGRTNSWIRREGGRVKWNGRTDGRADRDWSGRTDRHCSLQDTMAAMQKAFEASQDSYEWLRLPTDMDLDLLVTV